MVIGYYERIGGNTPMGNGGEGGRVEGREDGGRRGQGEKGERGREGESHKHSLYQTPVPPSVLFLLMPRCSWFYSPKALEN